MNKFLIFICLIIFVCSCASKPAVKASGAARSQSSQEKMDAAMQELDSGEAAPVPPAGTASRAETNAAIAQKELSCEMDSSGNKQDCQILSQEYKGTQVQEKARPGAVKEGRAPVAVTKYPFKDGFPIWFSEPGYGGYIGGVGVAKTQKSGGYPAQRRVALSLAQADLVRSVKVNVYNELSSERLLVDTKTQSYYKEKITTMSRQDAEEYIQNYQVMDEWVDSKTGELYIWIVLPR